ncbi:E3 ubiquitin-protein ligase TRIM33-like [Ruditapes philippinarum]|uniref:E3 ubiquitin-protein ligase TRIM33-like n=1 Tax=Ruditapes philippinarum TaxID=129788 RepID=UPI00295B39BB|nr:E3 ubiquitin-protein ligase TRIM33-like [Ruditapes philippinarum]
MDTLQQIKDEFLVCPICLRHYKEPKLLPCLHTFCLRCLEDFVHKTENRNHIENGDTTDEDHNSVIFKCPVCRGDTTFTLSEDGKKIESGFSDNHLISNIMEKIDVHKEEQICESCSARGQGQKAAKAEVYCQNCKVSFCESCIKAHNVIKACRDHVIISLSDIRVNPLQTLKNTKREIPCSEHKDKVLEFYCLDCRVAICSTCVAVQHRRCEMVETCADSAQKLKPETDNVLKDLDTQEVSLTDWQQEHLREIEELEENKSSLITEIKTVRKNVDYHLAKLEQSLLEELDVKHTNAIMSVKERLQEIEDLKKNLENTNRFLRHLVQFGSDSEFLSVFDKVKQQIIEMNTGINRRKIAKLLFRHKFALDMNLSRIFDLKSLGKLVDVVDMNKDSFPMNGENGLGPPSPVRKSSIKRTGTFRVDKAEEEQQAQQQEKIKPQKQQIALQPIPSQSKHSSRSSLSTNSPSTSNDSMSSQEMLESTPRRHAVSIRARQQQETSARLAAGSTGSLPRAAKRVNSAVEFRKSQAVQSTPSKGAKTPPIQRRRAQSTVNGRPPVGEKSPLDQKEDLKLLTMACCLRLELLFSLRSQLRCFYHHLLQDDQKLLRQNLQNNPDLRHSWTKTNAQLLCLPYRLFIQDPRGICTDLDGNVYLADKSAHAIHSLTSDGHYRKCVVSARDELVQPIAVCVSPFGHIIVTQDNGDIKVYAID